MDKKSAFGKPRANRSAQGEQTRFQDAFELLSARRYKQVEQLLLEQKEGAQQSGQMAMVIILAAACQLCLTCRQYRADRELHQLGFEESRRRERESRLQIQSVLSMLSQLTSIETQLPVKTSSDLHATRSEIAGPEEKESDKQPTWLRKAKQLLGFEPTTPLDKSRAGADRRHEETKASPHDQIELATPHRYPAQEQDTLAKTSVSPRDITITLSVCCLGTFRAYVNEQLIDDWKGKKSKSIFKYMITHRDRPIPLEILMDIFWHDEKPEPARRNLYQAIYLLRHALQSLNPEFPYILSDNSCYGLNPELEIWLDSEAFDVHYRAGQQFEKGERWSEAVHEYELAENLYEGDFLAEDIYEDWASTLRENLRRAYLDMLSRLSLYHFEQGNCALSIVYCHKILHVDNCHEKTHRCLMRAYMAQGQRHLALRQYHRCVEVLKQELQVSPMPETTEIYRQML